MTGIKLKPCPFCDSEATLHTADMADKNWVVECMDCRCATPWCGDRAIAVAKWNTRTKSESIVQVFGEWIYGERDVPHCSECGEEVKEISLFCPNCGANMETEDDDND